MAGQLTQRWNQLIWRQAARILSDPDAYTRDSAQEPPRKPRQNQRRLTAAQVDILVAEYQAGSSAYSLARQWHLDNNTVVRHLKSRNVELRQPKVAISIADHPELLALKAEGRNNAQIGRHFGCTRQAVQYALKRALKTQPAPARSV